MLTTGPRFSEKSHTSFWKRIQMLFYRIPSYLYRIFLIIYKEFSVISYTEYSPLFKQNFPWFQTRSYFSWVLSSVIYPRLFRTTVEPHKMSILDVAYGRWSLTWASLDHNENVNCWDFTHEPMPMQFVHVKSISRKKNQFFPMRNFCTLYKQEYNNV